MRSKRFPLIVPAMGTSTGPHATHPSLAYDLWTAAEKVVVRDGIDSGPGLVAARDGGLLAFFGSRRSAPPGS